MDEWNFQFPKDQREVPKDSNEKFIIDTNFKLGGGGQATIYAARLENTQVFNFAAKQMKSQTFGISIDDEFLNMYNIRSPFIIKPIKIVQINHESYMIMKKYDQSLKDFRRNKKIAKESNDYKFKVLCVISTLLESARSIHILKNSIIHHDITPRNVMIDKIIINGIEYLISILIDFGLVKNSASKTINATNEYKVAGNYSERTDILSIGLILLELIYNTNMGKLKFLIKTPKDQSFELSVIEGYEPKHLEKIFVMIKNAYDEKQDCIFNIMEILTEKEKFIEFIGEDFLPEEYLDRYFDSFIPEYNMRMEYLPEFEAIAPIIFGENFKYKSFLYTLFHQRNYTYNKSDFTEYQKQILKIYHQNEKEYSSDSKEKRSNLVNKVAKLHYKIDFFRLNCIIEKLYEFTQSLEEPYKLKDDEESFKSKLFQILISLDFNFTRTITYFSDSLYTLLYGTIEENLKLIQGYFQVDAYAKFMYLVKKQNTQNQEEFYKKMHDNFLQIFYIIYNYIQSEDHFHTLTKYLCTPVYEIIKEIQNQDHIYYEDKIFNFNKLTFEEFVESVRDPDAAKDKAKYEQLNCYFQNDREKFFEVMRNQYDEDFIYMVILLYIAKYKQLMQENNVTFLDFETFFNPYTQNGKSDASHLGIDMRAIYECKNFITNVLCKNNQEKCQLLVPDCIQNLNLQTFNALIKKLSKKNKFNDFFNQAKEYFNSKEKNLIDSLMKMSNFIYDLFEDEENRDEICKAFFDSNFHKDDKKGDENVVICVIDKKTYEMIQVEKDTPKMSIDKNKINFNFVCKTYDVFNYEGSLYKLSNMQMPLTKFLEENNPTPDQRSKIAVYLAYYYSFLKSLPYTVSFKINEKCISVDPNTSIPMIKIEPSKNSSDFKLLKAFGQILSKLQGTGDNLKTYNCIFSTQLKNLNPYLAVTVKDLSNISERVLYLSFHSIFEDFFNESYDFSFKGTDHKKFISSIKDAFRYDLKNEKFRSIATYLFGFDYLFKINYLFTKKKKKSTLTKDDFVQKICNINSYEFWSIENVLQGVINLLEENFDEDPYNFIHSLNQKIYCSRSKKKYKESISVKSEYSHSTIIDCEMLNEKAKTKLYAMSFKYIAPMIHQIKGTTQIVFDLPKKKYSKKDDLFKDANNKETFIVSLIAALSFLVKFSKDDFLIPSSSEPDIYLNEKGEAILLPYSITLEKAQNLFEQVCEELIPEKVKDLQLKGDEETFFNNIFKLEDSIYSFNFGNIIPFNYENTIKLRNTFGLDFIGALNIHLHFIFITVLARKNIEEVNIMKYVKDDFQLDLDLINFSTLTNILSPLFIQALELTMYYNKSESTRNDAKILLKAFKSIKELDKKLLQDIPGKSQKIINSSGNASIFIKKYGEVEIAEKQPEREKLDRKVLADTKTMLWRMKLLILRDEKSKEFFVNEIGFLDYNIIMDYYKNGDLKRSQFKNFSETEKFDIIFRVIYGVRYLHENRMYHGDLKPSNIFFNKDGRAIIGDLVSIRPIRDDEDGIGTYDERYCRKDPNGAKRDIFSLAIIIIYILREGKLYDGDLKNNRDENLLEKIKDFPKDNNYGHFKVMLEKIIKNEGEMPTITSFCELYTKMAGLKLDIPQLNEIDIWKSTCGNWDNLIFNEKVVELKNIFDKFNKEKEKNADEDNKEKEKDANKDNKEKEKDTNEVFINIQIAEKLSELKSCLMENEDNTSNQVEQEIINEMTSKLTKIFDNYINEKKNSSESLFYKTIEVKIGEIAYCRVLINGFNGLSEESKKQMKKELFKKAQNICQNPSQISLHEMKTIIDALGVDDVDAGFFYQLVLPHGNPLNAEIASDLKLRLDSIDFFYNYLEEQYSGNEYQYDNLEKFITSLYTDLLRAMENKNNKKDSRRRIKSNKGKTNNNNSYNDDDENNNNNNNSYNDDDENNNNNNNNSYNDDDENNNNNNNNSYNDDDENNNNNNNSYNDDENNNNNNNNNSYNDDDENNNNNNNNNNSYNDDDDEIESNDEMLDQFKDFLIGKSFKKRRISRELFIALFFCIFLENYDEFVGLEPLFNEVIDYVYRRYIMTTRDNISTNHFYTRMIKNVKEVKENGDKRIYIHKHFIDSK